MAATQNSAVWLLREARADDMYTKLLESHEYNTCTVPVLQFELCDDGALLAALHMSTSYSALVLTSQRAVHAIHQLLITRDIAQCMKQWNENPCYVVGKATAEAARGIGLVCRGEESGNALQLATFIKSELKECSLPVLFPCGNIKRETLPTELTEAGIDVECVTVYKTSARPDIEQALQNALSQKGEPSVAVFFSPSGVQFALPALQRLDVIKKDIKFVAIGGSTAECMEHCGLHVSATCKTPDPEGLVDALQSLKREYAA